MTVAIQTLHQCRLKRFTNTLHELHYPVSLQLIAQNAYSQFN